MLYITSLCRTRAKISSGRSRWYTVIRAGSWQDSGPIDCTPSNCAVLAANSSVSGCRDAARGILNEDTSSCEDGEMESREERVLKEEELGEPSDDRRPERVGDKDPPRSVAVFGGLLLAA